MARIFIDGFESGSADFWVLNGSSVNTSPPTGFTGLYYLNITIGSDSAYKYFYTDKAELYISFKCMFTANSTTPNCALSFFDSNGIVIAGLYRKASNGFLEFRLGNGSATLLSTGTTVISINTVYLIEIHYKPLNSGGIFQVKVNGAAMEIDYSGDTTAGLESVNRFGIFYVALNQVTYAKIDDVVVDDANWIGNTKIQAIVPTGAGATTGWTPSTGNNWAAVDEKPAVDTDYIKTSSNQIDTYAMGNLSGSIASIKSVAVQSRNWREGNGSYDRGQHIVRPASTDRLAASKTAVFPITATSFQSIWELNPEDSQAWEESDVNGMEAGIKAVTA